MLLVSTAAEIPWVAITPFILAFVAGVVLLLAGRRVMRIAFTGVGLLLGAALGWIVSQAVELPIPDWAVIIVPAIVLAAGAALAYKLAIAVVMALVLGIAAPLALVTAGDIGLYTISPAESAHDDDSVQSDASRLENEDDAEEPVDFATELERKAIDTATQELQDKLNDLGETLKEAAGIGAEVGEDSGAADEERENGITLPPEAKEHVDRAFAFVRDVFATAKARWDGFPQSLRFNLMLSAALGALLGLLLGALAPTLSASVASSGAGSAVCLVSASVIAARMGAADSAWMPERPGAWLALWLVLAIIGLAIQWTTRPKPVDKSR